MPHQFVCRKKIPALITRPLRLICSTIFWAILVSVSALPMRSESEFSPACHSSTQTSRARRNVPCGLAGRTPAGDPAKYSSTNATHTTYASMPSISTISAARADTPRQARLSHDDRLGSQTFYHNANQPSIIITAVARTFT